MATCKPHRTGYFLKRATHQTIAPHNFPLGQTEKDRDSEIDGVCYSLPVNARIFSTLCRGSESKYAKVREPSCLCELRGELIEFATSMLM